MNLKNSLLTEVEVRKIADMLDLRLTRDSLLIMDFSGANGESPTHGLNNFVADVSFEPNSNKKYTRFLSYGWLSRFGIKTQDIRKGIRMAYESLCNHGLFLIYDCQDEYLPVIKEELARLGQEEGHIFIHDLVLQNISCNALLLRVQKY